MNNEVKMISFIEHEAEMTRMERTQERLILACITLGALNIISVILWMI